MKPLKLTWLALASVVVATGVALADPPRKESLAYDKSTEVTLRGAIQDVMGLQGADGVVGMHLTLKQDDHTVEVHVGPAVFVGMSNFSFAVEDQIEVTGSKLARGNSFIVWARLVKVGDRVLTLRDENGVPLWPDAKPQTVDGCGANHEPIK
ncbi:MAG: hypothetical protein HYX76_01985 [Acidobacteria bacterium]|nr:hypothetical protein [Acidobacteriota bacterium]